MMVFNMMLLTRDRPETEKTSGSWFLFRTSEVMVARKSGIQNITFKVLLYLENDIYGLFASTPQIIFD